MRLITRSGQVIVYRMGVLYSWGVHILVLGGGGEYFMVCQHSTVVLEIFIGILIFVGGASYEN